jgi:hypothetical protein
LQQYITKVNKSTPKYTHITVIRENPFKTGSVVSALNLHDFWHELQLHVVLVTGKPSILPLIGVVSQGSIGKSKPALAE